MSGGFLTAQSRGICWWPTDEGKHDLWNGAQQFQHTAGNDDDHAAANKGSGRREGQDESGGEPQHRGKYGHLDGLPQ